MANKISWIILGYILFLIGGTMLGATASSYQYSHFIGGLVATGVYAAIVVLLQLSGGQE